MHKSITVSDTLIGGLSREMDSIRFRIQSLINDIGSSENKNLTIRLKNELTTLKERQLEVAKAAEEWLEEDVYDRLSIEFLLELTNRNQKREF